MTCIVGLVDDGRVWIGGDSQGTDGYLNCVTRADPKVFRLTGRRVTARGWIKNSYTPAHFLVGFAGSFRMGQLLACGFVPPDHDPAVSDYEYMVTRFVEAVRDRLRAGGFDMTDNQGGEFLVGYRGHLYVVESDFQVGIPAVGYAAVGSGGPVALGALWAMDGRTAYERVVCGLAAAEQHNAAVRRPWTVESEI